MPTLWLCRAKETTAHPASGDPSDPSPACREGVKKEAAEHLKWADAIQSGSCPGPSPHPGREGTLPQHSSSSPAHHLFLLSLVPALTSWSCNSISAWN